MEKNDSVKRIIGFAVGALVPFALSFVPVTEPLTDKSLIAVGLLIGSIIWIITGALKEYQGMLLMITMFVVTGCVNFNVAFGSFAGSSWWLMAAAGGIGVAAIECGVMKRIALLMLKAFPSNYIGQCLSYIFSGIILSPIIPSTAAKGMIISPLGRSTSEAMGFENHSKGAVGIFLAITTGYLSVALAFLSGSSVNYSVIAPMPQGYEVTWGKWLLTSLPWLIVSTVLMAIVICTIYRPKGKDTVSKEYVKEQLVEMGPWRWQEKATLAILLICLLFWIMEPVTGIKSEIIAIMGFIAVFAFRICPHASIKKMPWDSLIFVGSFLCLPTVFQTLGINAYIVAVMGDRLAPLMNNMYLLMPVICILVYVVRLVIVSLSATAVIITTIMLPFCAQYGIHPFVIAIGAYLCTNTWNVNYQNTAVIASLAATNNEWVTHKDIQSGSIWYMITSLIAVELCIPFWKLLGMC